MKRALIFGMLLLLSFSLKAQLLYPHYPGSYYFPAPSPESYLQETRHEEEQKDGPGIRWGVNVGGNYLSTPWYRGFSSFVAPSFRIWVTPRFHFEGGVRVERFFPAGRSYVAGEGLSGTAPGTVFSVYASGTYFLRPGLAVTGTVMKNFASAPALPPFAAGYRYVPDQYSLRLDYQITPSIHFGAEFRYMEYSQNPFVPGFMPAYPTGR